MLDILYRVAIAYNCNLKEFLAAVYINNKLIIVLLSNSLLIKERQTVYNANIKAAY